MKQTTVYLPEEQFRKFKSIVAEQGDTMSKVFQKLVDNYIDENTPKKKGGKK